MPIKGAEIKKLRARMGFTQAELGRELGVTENTVARWERDEMKMSEPAVRLLRNIAAQKTKRTMTTLR
jgi:DNA-binding transcriptional regulator YiaG